MNFEFRFLSCQVFYFIEPITLRLYEDSRVGHFQPNETPIAIKGELLLEDELWRGVQHDVWQLPLRQADLRHQHHVLHPWKGQACNAVVGLIRFGNSKEN